MTWRISEIFVENFQQNMKVITFSELNEPTYDRNITESSSTAKLKQARNVGYSHSRTEKIKL